MASGELVSDNLCLDGDGENPRKIVLYECHGLRGNQQWFITEVLGVSPLWFAGLLFSVFK